MSDATEPISGVTQILGPPDAPTSAAVQSSAPGGDTVQLSDTARATVLQGEGESVEEIAQELGISSDEVMADLGIAAAVVPTQQPAQPSTAPSSKTSSVIN
jgi:hypothetical protein